MLFSPSSLTGNWEALSFLFLLNFFILTLVINSTTNPGLQTKLCLRKYYQIWSKKVFFLSIVLDLLSALRTLSFFFFLTMPCSVQGLSSPTRGQTDATAREVIENILNFSLPFHIEFAQAGIFAWNCVFVCVYVRDSIWMKDAVRNYLAFIEHLLCAGCMLKDFIVIVSFNPLHSIKRR